MLGTVQGASSGTMQKVYCGSWAEVRSFWAHGLKSDFVSVPCCLEVAMPGLPEVGRSSGAESEGIAGLSQTDTGLVPWTS